MIPIVFTIAFDVNTTQIPHTNIIIATTRLTIHVLVEIVFNLYVKLNLIIALYIIQIPTIILNIADIWFLYAITTNPNKTAIIPYAIS